MPGDVFEEHPFGATVADDPGDIGPEMAGIVGAAAPSGSAEGLAGVSGEDGVKGAAERPCIEAARSVQIGAGAKYPARWAAMRTVLGQSSHSTKARV